MSALDQTLVNLAQVLSKNHIPYMVIGGMANAVWGEPRSTLDIDVTIWFDEKKSDKIISILTPTYQPLVSNPSAFIRDTSVLPLESKEGIRIDLIFGKLPYEHGAIERAVEITIHEIAVRFCAPEDLILHKIISERERDLNDAHGVVVRRMKDLDLAYLEPRIRELSTAMERPDIWALWEKWKREVEVGN